MSLPGEEQKAAMSLPGEEQKVRRNQRPPPPTVRLLLELLVDPLALRAHRRARLGDLRDRELESAQRLDSEGAEPWPLSTQDFARVIATEIDKWVRVAREAGIRAE